MYNLFTNDRLPYVYTVNQVILASINNSKFSEVTKNQCLIFNVAEYKILIFQNYQMPFMH